MQLHHGDCLDILPTLPDKSVDAVICDPPYGTTACKWDSVIPFAPMWEQLKRIIKPRGAIVLFGSQPFTSALVMSNVKMFKYQWVWDKVTGVGFQIAKYRPMMQHEDVIVFCNGTPKYNPIMVKRDKPIIGKVATPSKSSPLKYYDGIARSYTHKFPKSILTFNKAAVRGLHPTQKPLPLLEYLVKTYTNAGDTVLDFTFGSGTTGVACVNLDRDFIGIEKDDQYFNLGSSRINLALTTPRQQSILD